MKREPRFLLWVCRKFGLVLPTDNADRSFRLNWVLHGTQFALGYGVLMALLEPVLKSERSGWVLMLTASLAGMAYGLMMALTTRKP